jgi:hypothetical protein
VREENAVISRVDYEIQQDIVLILVLKIGFARRDLPMSVQVIERNGKPEWAVLPFEDYLQLVEQAEMLQDIQEYDRAKAAVESGEEEVLPRRIAYPPPNRRRPPHRPGR